MSYGGSSLVSAFIVFAIIQALYIIQGNEDEFDEYEMSEDDPDFGVDTLFEDGFSDVGPGYRGNVNVEDL